MCAETFRDSPRAGRGGQNRSGLVLYSGAPGGKESILGPIHPHFYSPSPRTQEMGTRVPAAKGGEQMLSAHSRKQDTPHPAAHKLSHQGLPLVLTNRPVARRVGGGGTTTGSVPRAAVRSEEDSLGDNHCDLCFCPELRWLPICWANLNKLLFFLGLQQGPPSKGFIQRSAGFHTFWSCEILSCGPKCKSR